MFRVSGKGQLKVQYQQLNAKSHPSFDIKLFFCVVVSFFFKNVQVLIQQENNGKHTQTLKYTRTHTRREDVYQCK